MGENSGRSLQYGPQTQLVHVRGTCVFTFLKKSTLICGVPLKTCDGLIDPL